MSCYVSYRFASMSLLSLESSTSNRATAQLPVVSIGRTCSWVRWGVQALDLTQEDIKVSEKVQSPGSWLCQLLGVDNVRPRIMFFFSKTLPIILQQCSPVPWSFSTVAVVPKKAWAKMMGNLWPRTLNCFEKIMPLRLWAFIILIDDKHCQVSNVYLHFGLKRLKTVKNWTKVQKCSKWRWNTVEIPQMLHKPLWGLTHNLNNYC